MAPRGRFWLGFKSQTSQGPDYWAAKASSLRAALDPHLARMFDAAMDASTRFKSEFHGRYEDARRSAFAALQSERLQNLEPGAPPPLPLTLPLGRTLIRCPWLDGAEREITTMDRHVDFGAERLLLSLIHI